MGDALLLAVVVWAATRARRMETADFWQVAPRPYLEGGRYWTNGVECHERRNPWLADQVREARRQQDMHGVAP